MRMCYGRSCLVGGHILQVDMSYRKSCIMGYISNERLCLKVGHVLQ